MNIYEQTYLNLILEDSLNTFLKNEDFSINVNVENKNSLFQYLQNLCKELNSFKDSILDYSTYPPSISNLDNDEERLEIYKLQDPKDTLKYKCGFCWDISLLAISLLKNIGINAYAIYAEQEDMSDFPNNHCTVVFEYKNELNLFEASWNKHHGIYGPFKEEDICNKIANWLIDIDSTKKIIPVTCYKILSFPEPGCSAIEFIQQCRNNEKLGKFKNKLIDNCDDKREIIWSEEMIKSIEDLKEFYKVCEYSIVDFKKEKRWNDIHKETTFEDLEKYWRFLTPEQILEYKCGICYDTAAMNNYFMNKWNIIHINMFAYTKCSDDNDYNDDPTHTFTIYLDEDDKWKWLEGSWNLFKNNDWSNDDKDELIQRIGKVLANSSCTTNFLGEITEWPEYGCNMSEFYNSMKSQIMYNKYEIKPVDKYSAKYKIYGAILGCLGDNANNIEYTIEEELPDDPWIAIIKSTNFLTYNELKLWHKYHTVDVDEKGVPYYFIVKDEDENKEYVWYSDDKYMMPINTTDEIKKAKNAGRKKHLKEEQLDFEKPLINENSNNLKKHYLYTYVPKINTVSKDGVYGPYKDTCENLVERYGQRAGSTTKKDILKWLESTFKGRTKCISVLTEPIPDNASPRQKEFRDNSILVRLPSYEELKDLKIAVGLRQPFLYGPGSDEVEKVDYSPIEWSRKNGKFTFSGVKHYFLITKDGYIPSEYCTILNN